MKHQISIKKVFIIANSNVEYNFAIRLSKALNKINYECIVSTLKPSLYLKLKRKGIKSFIIGRKKKNEVVPYLNELVKVSNNVLLEKEVIILYTSIQDHVQQLLDKKIIDFLFILNGMGPISLPLSELAKKKSVPRIYFELANIPGKLFVDPKGVNASSSIYENIDRLVCYKSSESEYQKWREQYIEYRRKNNIIPQIDKAQFKNNFLYLIDYISCKIMKIPVSGEYRLKRKLYKKLKRVNFSQNGFSTIGYDKYIFLPLQVGSDTQLVYNSDIDNISALKICVDIAAQKDLALVVKLHPACSNKNEIDHIENLKQELNFTISNCNTYDLLVNAEEVITINSSVGLDGLIFNKEVKFLGKSFYSKLNQEYLRNYIMTYLINIDYFSKDEIDTKELLKIFDRASEN